jgi:hypothetical protein
MANTPISWRSTLDQALEFLKTATAPARIVRQAWRNLPSIRHHILLQPETWDLYVGLDKAAAEDDAVTWRSALLDLGFPRVCIAPIDCQPPGFGEQPWVWLKTASSPIMATTAKLLNYQPSEVNKIIGGPSPLAAAITSAMLGAGVGYGAGALGEQLLPEDDFNRGTLRRNTAIAGAALATAPALLWGITAHQAHPETPGVRAWLSGWPFRPQDQAPMLKHAAVTLRDIVREESKTLKMAFDDEPFGQGVEEIGNMPMIPKDEFGRAVWQDANTPLSLRAATTGLVNAASYASGNSPWVSPYDIAAVTATGAARGLIVGKTLGVLAGLKPQSQQNLQRLGVWSGMLQAVVPNAFPNPSQIFR